MSDARADAKFFGKVASNLHFVLDCKSNPAPIIPFISRWPVSNDNQWNLQNAALPVKLHSWSVDDSFEGSFVHTCFGAFNCSTLVSPKGCVLSERGPVHLNSDWINSSMSFRVSSQSESNCMELIWKGGLFELSWDLWKGVSRMNQFCRSSGWWIDCTTSWEEFIPGVFVQRLPIISWSVAGFRGEFCFGSYRSPQCTVISLYLLSKQVS